MPRHITWTDDAILAAIRQFIATYGRPPTRAEFRAAYGLPDRQTIARSAWRTWEEPVRQAVAQWEELARTKAECEEAMQQGRALLAEVETIAQRDRERRERL